MCKQIHPDSIHSYEQMSLICVVIVTGIIMLPEGGSI